MHTADPAGRYAFGAISSSSILLPILYITYNSMGSAIDGVLLVLFLFKKLQWTRKMSKYFVKSKV